MSTDWELHDVPGHRRFELGSRLVPAYFNGRYHDDDKGNYTLDGVHAFVDIRRDGFAHFRDGMLALWNHPHSVSTKGLEEDAHLAAACARIWDFFEKSDWQVEIVPDNEEWPAERYQWPLVGTIYDAG